MRAARGAAWGLSSSRRAEWQWGVPPCPCKPLFPTLHSVTLFCQQVPGARRHRPRSWAAGEGQQRWGPQPVERRVMTAEVLAQHLTSLQLGARQGGQEPC